MFDQAVKFQSRCLQSKKLRLKASKNFVCILQSFFASDIKPFPRDLKRLYRFARVEPLHKMAWLVGIIACSKIIRLQRQNHSRVVVNSDCSKGSLRLLQL